MQSQGRSSHPVQRAARESPQLGSRSISTNDATNARLPAEDSWVEISSQPSSSSLSSTATDEIVTAGLQVSEDTAPVSSRRRGRRYQKTVPRFRGVPLRRRTASGDLRHDESEESEGDDRRALSNSMENVIAAAYPFEDSLQHSSGSASECHDDDEPMDETHAADDFDDDDEYDDDDGNSTALGPPNDDQIFKPQPNAFSHPPQSGRRVAYEPSSYFAPRPGNSTRQSGVFARGNSQQTPHSAFSQASQADHDAALRASLSTLLSCAAAARGLPKQNPTAPTAAPGLATVEPSTLRVVSESAIVGQTHPTTTPSRTAGRTTRGKARSASDASSTRSSTSAGKKKGKRKAPASASHGSKDHSAKKSKRAATEAISPTLLAWAVSAGVVVLVSALGFSAGYVIGRETGRAEIALGIGGASPASNSSSCGREVAARGLNRLRWGAASASSVRA